MEFNERLFEKIGLTNGEIKVYSALLSIGESTIGLIVSESKVSKSKVYDILDKLISKGFVGYTLKENIKYFFINNPSTIVDYLDKKEDEIKKNRMEIEKVLPDLLKTRNSFLGNKIAEIYQGFNGMKTIRDELMLTYKKGEELLVLGAPKIANEKFEGWMLGFHKTRIKRGVGMKIIYNWDAREYGKIREKMKITEVKYFQEGINSPNWIDVFPEAVMITVIVEEPICLVIRNKEVADSFRSYFEIMWKNAIT